MIQSEDRKRWKTEMTVDTEKDTEFAAWVRQIPRESSGSSYWVWEGWGCCPRRGRDLGSNSIKNGRSNNFQKFPEFDERHKFTFPGSSVNPEQATGEQRSPRLGKAAENKRQHWKGTTTKEQLEKDCYVSSETLKARQHETAFWKCWRKQTNQVRITHPAKYPPRTQAE